ncbi:alpha/beta fold hydrolase, partial [Streptococcus agalactiae]|uniref:alpha/beta fold hydrolase n=1 Tax=Streptococcus agalactiae TaxID=1311 RepID=UPI003628E66A
LSDIPTKPRTLENITKEIHTGLNKIGVKNFYLAAHSLGGMYSLNYAKNYPEEVRGFIGMDTSTPWMEGEQKTNYDPESAKWAMKLPDVDDKSSLLLRRLLRIVNSNSWSKG